jgi:hypothetical protein
MKNLSFLDIMLVIMALGQAVALVILTIRV